METRNIPRKNYIILAVIVFVTFALLYFLVSYYDKRKEYESSIHTRMGFLSEIKESEIQNYILDNHDAIIYISDSTDTNYQTFETELKNLMLEENLTKDVIYMDMYKMSPNFFKNFQKEFIVGDFWLNTLVYPNVFIVSDGVVTSALYASEQEKNPRDVILFVKEYLDNE